MTESFARKQLPGRRAVRQSFQIASPAGDPRPAIQIVGVARDTKYTDLREAFTPIVHVAMAQGEPDDWPAFAVHATTALPAVTAAATRALAGRTFGSGIRLATQ